MRSRIQLLTVLIVVTVPLLAMAGTTGKVTGIVKDGKTGEAIVGASVLIEGTTMGAATNLDGYYVILNIPPGKYNLVASGVGYTKKAVNGIQVSIDLTTQIDFGLESEVIQSGEEVVITAERPLIRKDLTSSQARVDAAQIEQLAVHEVKDVLSLQAGVTTDQLGGIHIRGGRSSEVGYWVDGISVSDVYDGAQAVQVNQNAVQELQVISGTFNAEYGQAMSGIVNIVTKDGDPNYHANLSTYIGDYVTPDNIFYNLNQFRPVSNKNVEGSLSGPIVPDLTFYLSGRYYKTDGWLYGDRTFLPSGALAPGADTIKDANGNFAGIRRPGSPVPMNNSELIYGQFKLTYQVSGGIKFAVTAVGSRNNYRDYNHDYYLNPDGDVNKYDRGYNVSSLWTHTLNARSFYTLSLSFFEKNFKEHLYADPFDPRYNMDPAAFSRNLQEFYHGGTNLHQFKRSTETRAAKIDYTNQIGALHELKAGAEARLHQLYLQDYYIYPAQDTLRNSQGVLTTIYKPAIPVITASNYQEYTEQPIELSAYVQDKLEYERMIVNFGVRFDYFNSKGKILSDPNDPNVYLPQKPSNIAESLDVRLAKWYKKASAKSSVSPRLGISYPITDKGVLHFSYGHFFQIPSFSLLYQNPGYKVNAVDPVQGVYGNADLKPQRTVQYELGLQQQLTDEMSFDVTGFYRDTRDWVGTSPKIYVRDATGLTATQSYTIFVNEDYANSRGITLTVNRRPSNKWTMSLSYTFQIAEGTNSSPDEAQGAITSNKEPTLTLTPLNWDQTHTLNLNVGFGLEDWGVFLLGRYGSGLPYSPVINQANARGQDAARIVTKNSRRGPETYDLDLRAFKNFKVGDLGLSAFVKVFNLLDRRNEITVYGETGRASATAEQLGLGGTGGLNRINTVDEFLVRPDYYSSPREIQVGLELNF